MPVVVSWKDDNKTILHYQYMGQWTWDELWTLVEKTHAQTLELPYKVDVIADLTESTSIPPNALTHLRKAIYSRPVNRGALVFVSNSYVVHSLLIMARGVLRTSLPLVLVPTVEDALAHIEQVRQERNALDN